MSENRHRHTVWMDDTVWDQVESHYQKDNCSTKNEYIEKAIRFYSGYLDAKGADTYLPRVLADVLANLFAYGLDVDIDTLQKLRVRCVKEVRDCLDKTQRRRLMHLVDSQNLLKEQISLASFTAGFKLA